VTGNVSLSGDIQLSANATVVAGATLTLAAGAVVHAAAGTTLTVSGTLVAQGTDGQRVTFASQADGAAGDWVGIAVQAGGTATLSYISIRDAQVAFQAAGNGHYTIDHLDIERSSYLLKLLGDGTIAHGTLHGLGAAQSNHPIEIDNASPQLSDLLVDSSNSGVDMIVLGGTGSAPLFDHLEVTQSHCAFHFNQGTGAIIRGSYVHGNVYALMVEGSMSTRIESSNLVSNSVNVGECLGGSVMVAQSYVQGTLFDSSCNGQGFQGGVTSPLSGVGPRP
jgi:hypothetical protein